MGYINQGVQVGMAGDHYDTIEGSIAVDDSGTVYVTDVSRRNVQKFGAGLEITRRTLERNGNPPPEFTVDAAYIGVVVRSAR